MLLPIEDYCKSLQEKDPSITPAEMLHNLHLAGYDREASVLQVKKLFSALTADELCLIIVNEYISPLIEKGELRRLLLLCGYPVDSVDTAIALHYPKSLGYILMLDDSRSIYSASAMIKIDAKAFLDCSRTGDQFGVNQFSTNAAWLYPAGASPQPATVTESRGELTDAKSKIEALTADGPLTNIGAAISLGNEMAEKLQTDKKSFVLISDGEHNFGPRPAEVLKNEPPIYIAGLGPYMKECYFKDLLDKNEKSKFYNSPNAYDMMGIFNQILADSSASLLRLNHLETCLGSNYSIHEFTISAQGNRSLINVVWSDKKYQYTPGFPEKNFINLVLISPDGRQTSIRPDISEAGFCIYDMRNVRPGAWKILAQYTVSEPVFATVGVIETGSPVTVEVRGAQLAKAGECAPYLLTVSNSSGLGSISVDAVYSRPAANFQTMMQTQFGQEGPGEADRPLANYSKFSRLQTFKTLTDSEAGTFRGSIDSTQNPGIYNAYFTVRGQYLDGTPFLCQKLHSVIVQ